MIGGGRVYKLQGSGPAFVPQRSQFLTKQTATGVKVGGDNYALVQDGGAGSLPFRKELAIGAIGAWSVLTRTRDMLTLLLGVHLVHATVVTKFASFDTVYDSCASHSFLALAFVLVHLLVMGAVNIARALIGELSISMELITDVWSFFVGFVLASASSSHRWQLEQGTNDVCSSSANGHSANMYVFADIVGIGAFLRAALLAYAKPPCGPGWLVVLIFAIVCGVVQLAVLDLFVTGEVSKIWETVEVNGTQLDNDLNDALNRISSLENLLNGAPQHRPSVAIPATPVSRPCACAETLDV